MELFKDVHFFLAAILLAPQFYCCVVKWPFWNSMPRWVYVCGPVRADSIGHWHEKSIWIWACSWSRFVSLLLSSYWNAQYKK